jgi:dihydrofolate reductase
MRKVVATLFISLDGVVESPNVWQFDHFDAEMGDLLQSQLSVQDAVMMGRVTYGEWSAYWPTSTDEPFASYINNTPKYVVSSTLESVDWQNSTLLEGDLSAAIIALKQSPGQNIGVVGSPSLVASLLKEHLLDELTLTIHPVIAGSGRRLFQDASEIQRLELITSYSSSSGVVIATYKPRA